MLLSPGDGQADAGRPGPRARLADLRRDFRPWREQRPFAGGVLVALAGLEMLFLRGPIGLDQLGVNVVLQFGVEGAQATILPVALILLGILSIAQPVHRVFYGVIALAISVYSIAGVNLGGWVAGFLLGVVGGVIVVSWAPPSQAAADDTVPPERAAGSTSGVHDDGVAPEAEDVVAQGEGDLPASDTPAVGAPVPEADEDVPRADRDPAVSSATLPQTETLSSALRALSQKSATVLAVSALALGGSLPASASASTSLGAQVRQDDSLWCVVFGACADERPADPSVAPSPTPGSAGPGSAGPGTGEDPVGDVVDGATGADPAGGGGADTGDGAGPAENGPGADADAHAGAGKGDQTTDDDSECQEPTQDGVVPPTAGESAPSDPCGAVDPQQTIEEALHTELGTCVKVGFGGRYDLNIDLPGQCGAREDGSVFSLPADLESRDLTVPLTGINGIGLANVPVKGGGERRDAIKISADKVVVDGFWLKSYAYDDGTTAGTDTRASLVSLEGDAHMYVSSIHANLPAGQDLLKVATQVLEGTSLVEILLTATDARLGFIGATSDIQVWDGFREQVWGDETDPIGTGRTAGTP